MPRKKSQVNPQNKSLKSVAQPGTNINTSTIEKNDKKSIENGLDGCNMVRESDTNKYLHKKFKKVATLDETSTPRKVQAPLSNEESPRNGRSRSHRKMDSQSSEEEEGVSEVKKIYKPKFHLEEKVEVRPNYSPCSQVLQMRINKLISDNQAIVNEPIWPKKSGLSPLRNGDSRSPFKSSTPEPDETQPLNLTVKEPRKRSLSETLISKSKGGSIIKDILLKTREKPDLTKITDVVLHPCPNCKVVFRTLENLNTHLYSCKPKSSPGPLLGKTPLVDSYKDFNKKRKLDFSLSLEDRKSVKLFGGEVKILDTPSGEAKTLRMDGRKDYTDHSTKKEVLMISKTGLHCSVGRTMIQSECVSPVPIHPEKMVLPLLPPVAPLNVPGMASPLRFHSSTVTAYSSMTLPPSPVKTKSPPYNGVVTIYHAGKPIPYVQGIPGPNSLLASPPLVRKKQEKTVVKPSPQKVDPKLMPLRIEVENKRDENNEAEKRFLRPTSLPLKPGTFVTKKSLTTPNLMPLVSPETPRPKKSYGQFFLNGHAYTYLGMKISTKPFFCTKQPQPIYVPLSPDQYSAVSMYSYWEVIKDKSPTPPGLDTIKAMSYYDSRNRDSSYSTSNRNRQDLMTHSTYFTKRDNKPESETSKDSVKEDNEPNPKRIKVCEGGFESNEDYVYVRGRGRGRYVCEECGIRCKKPSMLKKHIRTHTDLRPYTCKYCAFSFKTKGNLTKHMKSKTHYKRCKELDISPIPTEDDIDSMGDDEDFGDDESEDETDEDDEDDSDEEDCEKEREAARSLLSLSEAALETAHRQYVCAGLIPQSSRPLSYPYQLPLKDDEGEKRVQPWMKDLYILTKDCPDFKINDVQNAVPSSESAYSPSSVSSAASSSSLVRPMDLSHKPIAGCAKPSVITSVGGPIVSLTPVGSNIENIPPSLPTPTTEYPENSLLLHAYLTERAVRDLKIKQQQMSDSKSLPDTESSKEEKSDKLISPPIQEAEKVIRVSTPPPAKSPPDKLIESPSKQPKAEFFPPSSTPNLSYISTTEDGRSMCVMCNKVFNKPSQLRLHVNIHYFERPFRCDSCAVSFRTKGHLQKHQRSLAHLNKVNMNSTFGTATISNPRPFKCTDCKVAFRIHGHLAKHFRSKMHIMKLECTGKLPFGTYADLEKFGVNMNDIDTTDCENSLESLQLLAAKMANMVSKSSKKVKWEEVSNPPAKFGSDDEGNAGIERISPPKNPSTPPLPPAPCFQKQANF